MECIHGMLPSLCLELLHQVSRKETHEIQVLEAYFGPLSFFWCIRFWDRQDDSGNKRCKILTIFNKIYKLKLVLQNFRTIVFAPNYTILNIYTILFCGFEIRRPKLLLNNKNILCISYIEYSIRFLY